MEFGAHAVRAAHLPLAPVLPSLERFGEEPVSLPFGFGVRVASLNIIFANRSLWRSKDEKTRELQRIRSISS